MEASEAARHAADAAAAANEQAKVDSIEQTRPYVYAEIVPALASHRSWDLKITNSGKSSARQLTLGCSNWPDMLDDVSESVKELFETPRTLPPAASIRCMWRLEADGEFTDGTTEAGMPQRSRISVSYSSDDPSAPEYADEFDAMLDSRGFWPVPEAGPRADGLKGDARKFYVLGQALVRRVGELNR